MAIYIIFYRQKVCKHHWVILKQVQDHKAFVANLNFASNVPSVTANTRYKTIATSKQPFAITAGFTQVRSEVTGYKKICKKLRIVDTKRSPELDKDTYVTTR